MKKITSPIIQYTIVAISILLIFSGCEKVIDIPLQQSDLKIVVEGTIIDKAQPFSVRITSTQDFFSKEKAPVVTGAMVYIIDNTGITDTLFYTTDGVGIAEEIRKIAIPMYGRFIHHKDETTAFQPYGNILLHTNSIFNKCTYPFYTNY